MVARKTHRIPACRHVEIGGQLQDAREQLLHLTVELSRAYPQTSKQVRAAQRAQEAVDELRNVLDGVSSNELPEEGWTTTIYYGANREGREVDMARVLKLHRADNPPCCSHRV